MIYKTQVRRAVLKLLKSQKEESRLKKSKAIQKKLFGLPVFKRAKIILFYASFDGEVETFRMMKLAKRLGKKIALPTIIQKKKKMTFSLVGNFKKDLEDGPYGIKQPSGARGHRPVDLETVDLAIVPGVAFDCDNNRLGRGAGYYDRFLSKLSLKVPTIGLAFDFQIVPRLPHHKGQDIPVSSVITN